MDTNIHIYDGEYTSHTESMLLKDFGYVIKSSAHCNQNIYVLRNDRTDYVNFQLKDTLKDIVCSAQ